MRISDWSSDVCSSDLLGDAGHGFQLVAQEPVLKPAELRQVMPAAPVDQRIFIDPADAGRIGTERATRARRQSSLHLVEIFEHTAARPVEEIGRTAFMERVCKYV